MPQTQTFTDVQPIQQTFSDVTPLDNPSSVPGAYQTRKGGPVLNAADIKKPNQFESDVVQGLGLNPQKVAAAGPQGEQWREVGRQALSGAKNFAVSVAKDPFNIAAPIESAATGIETGIREGRPGLVIGSAAPIAAGLEAPELASDVAKTGEIVKAIPKATGKVVRAVGNPYGLASTGEEMLTQGISPYAKATGFKNALTKAGSDIKAFDSENPIKGVQDLNDAIPEIKKKIWSEEVEPALQRQGSRPVDMKPVADAVRQQITPEMKEFDEGNADKLDALATKMENTRDITSANRLLKYVNGQMESYFAKYPSARRADLMANPETAGWEAARQSLRNQFLTTLENAGENGVRDARLRYGALEEIGKQVERRVNVADRAKPMSINRILGLAGAIPTGGLSVAAGELGHYLNKPDVLIRRGIANLPEATKTLDVTPAQPQIGPLKVPLGNPPSPAEIPQYAYRVRNSGERGVGTQGHAQATMSPDEARGYVESRGNLPENSGKKQELVRVDLSKLPKDSYSVKLGPNGHGWVKFNKEVPESAVEPLPSKPIKFRQNLNEIESMTDPDTRFNTARHEAGHAVISELLRPNSVQGVGLDDSGGYTLASPPMGKKSTKQLNPDEIRNLVAVSYAGGMSEPGGTTAKHVGPDQARRADILSGSATTPLSNLARIVTGHTFGQDQFLAANQQQAEAKARVNALLADPNNRNMIDSLAAMLNAKGNMSGPEVRAFLAKGGK